MQNERTLGANITLAEARKVAESALEAVGGGLPVSVAILDNAGVLVYFSRMDGATPNSAMMSQNKAYTAIQWRRDTKVVNALMKETEVDRTFFGDPRYAPLEGGVLLRSSDGAIVGAIGISGRLPQEPPADDDIAQAAAKMYRES